MVGSNETCRREGTHQVVALGYLWKATTPAAQFPSQPCCIYPVLAVLAFCQPLPLREHFSSQRRDDEDDVDVGEISYEDLRPPSVSNDKRECGTCGVT